MLCPAGAWQVRSFQLGGPHFLYLAGRDMWHLQLWHPTAGVSILTPSLVTKHQYEVFPVRGWKARAIDYAELGQLAQEGKGLPLPSESMLRALEA